ncbi:MAG: hypothetical protein ACSLE6_02870 [Mycobacterium sp.]
MFVELTPEQHARISRRYTVHQPDPLRPVFRFVCSWATSAEAVVDALETLRS